MTYIGVGLAHIRTLVASGMGVWQPSQIWSLNDCPVKNIAERDIKLEKKLRGTILKHEDPM